MTTVREAFYTVCRELGMTTIFGNPGSTEETMLADFPADFRYGLALQEAPAVALADVLRQRGAGYSSTRTLRCDGCSAETKTRCVATW